MPNSAPVAISPFLYRQHTHTHTHTQFGRADLPAPSSSSVALWLCGSVVCAQCAPNNHQRGGGAGHSRRGQLTAPLRPPPRRRRHSSRTPTESNFSPPSKDVVVVDGTTSDEVQHTLRPVPEPEPVLASQPASRGAVQRASGGRERGRERERGASYSASSLLQTLPPSGRRQLAERSRAEQRRHVSAARRP